MFEYDYFLTFSSQSHQFLFIFSFFVSSPFELRDILSSFMVSLKTITAQNIKKFLCILYQLICIIFVFETPENKESFLLLFIVCLFVYLKECLIYSVTLHWRKFVSLLFNGYQLQIPSWLGVEMCVHFIF